MSRDFIFTSESVSEGHPDKMSDQVSDAILDAIIAEDKHARVACETVFKTGLCMIALIKGLTVIPALHLSPWVYSHLISIRVLTVQDPKNRALATRASCLDMQPTIPTC